MPRDDAASRAARGLVQLTPTLGTPPLDVPLRRTGCLLRAPQRLRPMRSEAKQSVATQRVEFQEATVANLRPAEQRKASADALGGHDGTLPGSPRRSHPAPATPTVLYQA